VSAGDRGLPKFSASEFLLGRGLAQLGPHRRGAVRSQGRPRAQQNVPSGPGRRSVSVSCAAVPNLFSTFESGPTATGRSYELENAAVNGRNAQIAVIAGRVANGSNRPLVHFKICPVNAREARESGLWLNVTHLFEPKRAFHSVRVPSAAARSATPNVRRQLQRPFPPPWHLWISVIPCAARRRHRGRQRQSAIGFRTASRRNQRPSAVVVAGPANSRGTADGQSPARPTARYGHAPCRSARCRSRNCNRRRNPHNPAGAAATVGVWRRTAAVARRRD
jgi:hypothetical protein